MLLSARRAALSALRRAAAASLLLMMAAAASMIAASLLLAGRAGVAEAWRSSSYRPKPSTKPLPWARASTVDGATYGVGGGGCGVGGGSARASADGGGPGGEPPLVAGALGETVLGEAPLGEAEAAPELNPTAPALDEVSGPVTNGSERSAVSRCAVRSAGGRPAAPASSSASAASSSRTPFLSSSRMESHACPAATCEVNRRSLAAHRSGSICPTGCDAVRNACTARGPVGEDDEPLEPLAMHAQPLAIDTAGSISGAVAGGGGGSSSAFSSTRTRSPQSAKLASFL